MCIFCKIVNGELPCHKVYEDENVIAFLDINPATYGHTLVLPKIHIEKIEDASEECLSQLSRTLPALAKQIKKNCNALGFNYISNSGKISGQLVDHLHFHIIPRYENDNFSIQHGAVDCDLKEVLSTILKMK